MRDVYALANRVLVLDAELTNRQVAPAPKDVEVREDVQTLITVSSWQRRYWTLQEGLLARRLYFQIGADAYYKVPIDQFLAGKNTNVLEYFFDNQVGYYCDSSDYAVRTTHRSRVRQVTWAFQALKDRDISVTADIPLCLGIVLDFQNVGKIEGAADRAAVFWEQLDQFPAGALFIPGKRFVDMPHLRWALCLEAMNALAYLVSPVLEPAVQGPDGVSLTLYGLVLDPLEARMHVPKAVFGVEIGGMTYFVRQNKMFGGQGWNEPDFIDGVSRAAGTKKRLAVILGLDPPEDGVTCPELMACLGALVVVEDTEANAGLQTSALFVTYLRAVSVIRMGSATDEAPRQPWTDDELKEKAQAPKKAQWTAVRQQWTITSSA